MATIEKEVIKEGYEKVVEILKTAIEEIETAKQAEINEVVAPIEEKYANRLADYKNDLARYVTIEVVEVEEETPAETTEVEEPVEEQAKDTEVVE